MVIPKAALATLTQRKDVEKRMVLDNILSVNFRQNCIPFLYIRHIVGHRLFIFAPT